ncbi:hypothetical protein FQN55_008618 [Onygenales sp. PD_40]|nr:hypothetical protein FQN55_008618 [Onygenales sp. PD_40]KAK2785957.1 hypothetical protein FQN51_003765 [Onygenales sp. PD_10]KAK2792180.1 hypothetical protein FQN52_003948 [Onygenales sp. PD_12]
MASIRAPAVRNIIGGSGPLLRNVQKRWAQVHDVRFLATHHEPDRVLDKYRDKLQRKAKEEGHSSVSALKDAYQDKIKDLRTRAETIPQPLPSASQIPNAGQTTTSPPPAQSTRSAPSPASKPSSQTPGIKPLSAYLDIPKILTLPAKEIETLWRLRHAANSQSICATVPLDTYLRMANTARQNPQFVLPLPRISDTAPESKDVKEGDQDSAYSTSTGADIHFLQWGFHPPATAAASPPEAPRANASTLNTHTSTVIFTHLAAYKLHGAYAQPHTIITHHLDLADEKGLVLLNGTVVADRGISVEEAKWLVMWLQRFYDWGVDGNQAGRKAEMLRMFTQGDVQGFKLEELMEEVEKV